MYLIPLSPRFVYLYIKYTYFFLFSKYCSCVYRAAKLCILGRYMPYCILFGWTIYNSAYLSQLVIKLFCFNKWISTFWRNEMCLILYYHNYAWNLDGNILKIHTFSLILLFVIRKICSCITERCCTFLSESAEFITKINYTAALFVQHVAAASCDCLEEHNPSYP